jgi:alkylation response protein AidB-like acyl-CoA dehydrogenase
MKFTLTDEQRMFAEAARTLLADTCTSARLRELMATDEARDPGRWQAIVDSGFTNVLLPDAIGGMGLTDIEFALIAEVAGYFALPEPLVESAGVAVPLLAAIDPHAASLVDAAATIAIQHPLNPFVADADTAAMLLLVDEGGLHLVPAASVKLQREPSIDAWRRLFRVDWTPSHDTRIADAAAAKPLLADAFDRGALFTAAQCLGIAQRCVDLGVAYAKERQQFGKPIGSYQAVKHLLASAQVKIEFARPVVHAAAAQFAQRDVHSRARISQAKLDASEAAELAASTALQVHGAMGYSWEVDVHVFLKRALALTFAWGDPAFHRTRVAARIFGQLVGPDQTFAHEDIHA